MSLPTSMAAKRASLEAQEQTPTAPTPTPEPVAEVAPTSTTEVQPTPGEGERITITRTEFNDLQAAAGKTRAAEGRLEMLNMDMEAMRKRLTELEDASKGNPKPSAPAATADVWEAPTVEGVTEQEQADYGESIPLIEKVAKRICAQMIKEMLPTVTSKIDQVKSVAESTAGAVVKSTVDAYTAAVAEEVGNMEECVEHEHWQAFLESFDDDTSLQVGQLVRNHIDKKNIKGMVKLFDKFKAKYGVGTPKPTQTGYEGAKPGGGTAEAAPRQEEQKLPFSKRKEAHDKYIKGQMDASEYEKIKDQYNKADAEGRVDYNK